MMGVVFELKQVTKVYSKFTLGPIDLKVPKGFATALIGSNGAGKTTLLDILVGDSRMTKGEIRYWNQGTDLEKNDIKEQIGYVSSSLYFPQNWTVKQVAESVSFAYEGFHRDRFHELCEAFSIDTEKAKKKLILNKMSDGNKMRMMLATVFARDTKVLVLDEPASPLDPVMRDELCNMFRDYIADGNGEKSILFSTHNIADMEYVTDYAIFMEHGKVIEEGFVEELKDRYCVVRGEMNQYNAAKKHLLYSTQNASNFEGLCNQVQRNRLLNLDLVIERPTLQQLSILLLKRAMKKA